MWYRVQVSTVLTGQSFHTNKDTPRDDLCINISKQYFIEDFTTYHFKTYFIRIRFHPQFGLMACEWTVIILLRDHSDDENRQEDLHRHPDYRL